MAAGDVFPAEMPNRPIPPLDEATAEGLLSGHLDPDDAPPAYADVARLLRAAAAPPLPEELAGQAAALALFRVARASSAGVEGRSAVVEGRSAEVRGGSGPRGRPAGVGSRSGSRGRPAGVGGRLVAVTLAGVLVVGGAVAGGAAASGLWTVGGVPSSGPLRSPTGGPGAGAAGSGTPGVGSGAGPGAAVGSGSGAAFGSRAGAGSGGSGLLRPAGSGAVTERERAVARHGGGGGSRGGGAAHGAKPVPTPEAKTGKAKANKPGKPKAQKPAPTGPKATPGQGANRAGGKRN